MKTLHLLFCLFGTMVLSNVAYAEVNLGKQVPSVNQVIDALSPATNPDTPQSDDTEYEGDVTGKATRSIDMSRINNSAHPKAKKPRVNTPIPTPYLPETTAALSLEIVFDYNSAELTDYAKQQLKPVGEALASGKLSTLSFIVEGHTDAIGSDMYNQTLSEQRATSVKSFLVNNFSISATQIQAVGKGKNNLLDPNHPTSEVNRRVRIIARK